MRPPVLAIVGNVAALGEAFDWFSMRPLHGRTVVVTRPEGQSDTVIEQLRSLGANALHQSALQIEPVSDFDAIDEVLRQLDRYHWLVFTSANGVHHFLGRLHAIGLDGRALASVRIAGVGPSVADALQQWLLRCDLLPDTEPGAWNAHSLAQCLLKNLEKNGSQPPICLVVRADRGKTTVEETLRQAGHHVESLIVYRSLDTPELTPEVATALTDKTIDYVLVSSAHSARNLIRLMAEGVSETSWIAISEEVANVLREANLTHVFVAPQSHMQSMVDTLLEQESTDKT